MAFFAVFVPLLMLGVMVALGRYEELMLPTVRDDARPPESLPQPVKEPAARPRVTAAAHDSSREAEHHDTP